MGGTLIKLSASYHDQQNPLPISSGQGSERKLMHAIRSMAPCGTGWDGNVDGDGDRVGGLEMAETLRHWNVATPMPIRLLTEPTQDCLFFFIMAKGSTPV